jgi:ADP-ribose pyrophosphatase YjhB (NUDIX family)
MFKRILSAIFGITPTRFRRWYARFFNDQFSVTSGAIIINDEGKLLLLKHVFRAGVGWGIPGGFIKAGEQPEEAVRRELLEEAGLELKTVKVAFTRTLKTIQQVEILFYCSPNGTPEPKSMEIEEVGWFSLDELPESLSQDQRYLIKQTLSHIEKWPG